MLLLDIPAAQCTRTAPLAFIINFMVIYLEWRLFCAFTLRLLTLFLVAYIYHWNYQTSNFRRTRHRKLKVESFDVKLVDWIVRRKHYIEYMTSKTWRRIRCWIKVPQYQTSNNFDVMYIELNITSNTLHRMK